MEDKQKMLPVLESTHKRVLVLKARTSARTVDEVIRILLDEYERNGG